MCFNRDLADDLTQEVALYFLQMEEDKKIVLREKKLVKAWFIRTIVNQDRSKTSPFYKKYKTQPMEDVQHLGEELEDLEVIEEREEDLDLINAWVEDLFPSDKNIIVDYFDRGLTIMGIAEKYKVDKNYVVSVLTRVKASFHRRLIWRKFSKPVLQTFISENLAPMVGRKRLKAEERQFILDAHNLLFKTSYNVYFDREMCSYLLANLIQKLKI